jgi:hypothetical protein
MVEPRREIRDPAGRQDVGMKSVPPEDTEDSSSFDIPIEVTGIESLAGHEHDFNDEMPTEIFRPDNHPAAHLRRALPKASPRAAESLQESRPPGSAAAPPRSPPPAVTTGAGLDDWEGETVVKRPTHTRAPKIRDAKAAPDARAVNVDETVKLEGPLPVDEPDFDDTYIAPPPRRSR